MRIKKRKKDDEGTYDKAPVVADSNMTGKNNMAMINHIIQSSAATNFSFIFDIYIHLRFYFIIPAP